MYINRNDKLRILDKLRDIQRVATLETCGIPELVILFEDDYRVRLWFESWISRQAADIERILMEAENKSKKAKN